MRNGTAEQRAVSHCGFYPDTDDNLRAKGQTIWCAGDVVGRFRGLVPAMLSGYFCGLVMGDALG